jgi:hypothetical protein
MWSLCFRSKDRLGEIAIVQAETKHTRFEADAMILLSFCFTAAAMISNSDHIICHNLFNFKKVEAFI